MVWHVIPCSIVSLALVLLTPWHDTHMTSCIPLLIISYSTYRYVRIPLLALHNDIRTYTYLCMVYAMV